MQRAPAMIVAGVPMNAIHNTYWLLAAAAALILVGIGSSLVARRFGAPLLLVFLVVGMRRPRPSMRTPRSACR